MNERIKLLAEQARSYARYYVAECKNHGYYMEHNELEVRFEQKFAQLIVRECAGIYDKIDNGNPHLGTDDYLEALDKTFFGVEE